VYAGRDRRTSYEGIKDVVLSGNIEQAVKELGVTDVARAADKSRQSVYEALKAVASPVWLVLAVGKRATIASWSRTSGRSCPGGRSTAARRRHSVEVHRTMPRPRRLLDSPTLAPVVWD